jgi:hypothetical protein
LTTWDNSLWGILKEFSQLWLTNLQDLKIAMRNCFYDIKPSTWKKMSEITGNGSNNVRGMEGNMQMCCNVTAKAICGHSVDIKY